MTHRACFLALVLATVACGSAPSPWDQWEGDNDAPEDQPKTDALVREAVINPDVLIASREVVDASLLTRGRSKTS